MRCDEVNIRKRTWRKTVSLAELIGIYRLQVLQDAGIPPEANLIVRCNGTIVEGEIEGGETFSVVAFLETETTT